MSVDRHRVEALARNFWDEAGSQYGFPRDFERAATIAMPVGIVKLRELTVLTLKDWLHARARHVAIPADARSLMGCVICHHGYALLFVCGADRPDEIRITLAHEIAHVVVHYNLRRRTAVACLGDSITEVLDGDRAPTSIERTRAALSGFHIGPHIHLLPRENGAHSDRILRAEAEADDLAVELVAPRAVIAARLQTLPNGLTLDQRREALARFFGIPEGWFRRSVPDGADARPRSFAARLAAASRTR